MSKFHTHAYNLDCQAYGLIHWANKTFCTLTVQLISPSLHVLMVRNMERKRNKLKMKSLSYIKVLRLVKDNLKDIRIKITCFVGKVVDI